MGELLPRVRSLVLLAKRYDIGINIDAEEADRLEISLDMLEVLAFDPELAGFEGIGLVVQAYQKRCPYVIDYVIDLAKRSGRKFMVRLVKGAYWDAEIKRAQVDGMPGYPVYTRKVHTDVSYLICARKLLGAADILYPQFATHNAHTLSVIYTWASAWAFSNYEFQCLHGMGETLYDQVVGSKNLDKPCRIYAPVGSHETLLAYLVRRLLENGANSSFVNQIVDENVAIDTLITDPFEAAARQRRQAASGDCTAACDCSAASARTPPAWTWSTKTSLRKLGERPGAAAPPRCCAADRRRRSTPARWPTSSTRPSRPISSARCRKPRAPTSTRRWQRPVPLPANGQPPARRSAPRILERTADLFEAAWRRADGPGRARSRQIAAERDRRNARSGRLPALLRGADPRCKRSVRRPALGPVSCISPWNFPLAIFTGQVAAALAAGNVVLAKPAEQTPLIAHRAVELFHEAGMPRAALQLLPGRGEVVGAALTRRRRVKGVIFTGSTEVAQLINRTLAKRAEQEGIDIPLVAETGGQNALIVDSSALPEQVVQDVLTSAFDSRRPALLGAARAVPAGRYRRQDHQDAQGRDAGTARRQPGPPGDRYRPGDRCRSAAQPAGAHRAHARPRRAATSRSSCRPR